MIKRRTDLKAKRPVKKKGKPKLKGSFIGLRIDDDLKTRLEEFGDQEGKSTSDVLKDLIKKHVETKEAVDIVDLVDDDDDDEEQDNFHPKTGKPLPRKKITTKKKEQPVGQVSFETLLDDLLRYQGRLKELNALLSAEEDNAGWFGKVPPHLKVAKAVCEKKLKLISDQMKALFPDMPDAEEEKEDRVSLFG